MHLVPAAAPLLVQMIPIISHSLCNVLFKASLFFSVRAAALFWIWICMNKIMSCSRRREAKWLCGLVLSLFMVGRPHWKGKSILCHLRGVLCLSCHSFNGQTLRGQRRRQQVRQPGFCQHAIITWTSRHTVLEFDRVKCFLLCSSVWRPLEFVLRTAASRRPLLPTQAGVNEA